MSEGQQAVDLEEHITKRYDIKRRLGKGAYGIVWKAIDRKTKEVVAVKKIFDAFQNQTDAQRTYREIMFLKAFGSHPNIIKLHSVHKATNNKDIYLVFEYMDTDLHKVIQNKNILKDVHKRYIMYQLLKATMYMHSGNVIHRDQKPSNILLNTNCHCKMADFGLARSLDQLPDVVEGSCDPLLTDYVATRWYRAPEILVGSSRYTKGIDMWSLGCILAEMLLETPLFPGTSSVHQLELISQNIPQPSAEDLRQFGSGFGSKLLERPPAAPVRPLQEVLASSPPDAVDLVERLLVYNPQKRLTAAEALSHPYVARFRTVDSEPSLQQPVTPPLSDNTMLSIEEYRCKLYELASNSRSHSTSSSVRRHSRNKMPSAPNEQPVSVEPTASTTVAATSTGVTGVVASAVVAVTAANRRSLVRHSRHISLEDKSKPVKASKEHASHERRASLPKRLPVGNRGDGLAATGKPPRNQVQPIRKASLPTNVGTTSQQSTSGQTLQPTADKAKLQGNDSQNKSSLAATVHGTRPTRRRQFDNRTNLSTWSPQERVTQVCSIQQHSATLLCSLQELFANNQPSSFHGSVHP